MPGQDNFLNVTFVRIFKLIVFPAKVAYVVTWCIENEIFNVLLCKNKLISYFP